MVQLFELGSVHYEFYAINIKLDERSAEGMLDAIKSAAQENLYRVHELPEARLTLTVIYFNIEFYLFTFMNLYNISFSLSIKLVDLPKCGSG